MLTLAISPAVQIMAEVAVAATVVVLQATVATIIVVRVLVPVEAHLPVVRAEVAMPFSFYPFSSTYH